tara:strand:- start:231 stop:647 length:417 start_codon:yes stop_codon:yes gene_type:complete
VAKLDKALKALLKSLGKIPEDVGALKNIPDNQNLIQSPLPEGGKFNYINPFGEVETKDPGKIDFYLYSDDPDEGLVGSRFVNQTMNNELVNSLKKGNYEDSRFYMNSIQEKFQDFGASDSEADHVIDSILLNHYDVDE